MTNQRNEILKLSTPDKLTILGMCGAVMTAIVCSTAMILSTFYTTVGELQRKNDVQDNRLDTHDSEIARLRK